MELRADSDLFRRFFLCFLWSEEEEEEEIDTPDDESLDDDDDDDEEEVDTFLFFFNLKNVINLWDNLHYWAKIVCGKQICTPQSLAKIELWGVDRNWAWPGKATWNVISLSKN